MSRDITDYFLRDNFYTVVINIIRYNSMYMFYFFSHWFSRTCICHQNVLRCIWSKLVEKSEFLYKRTRVVLKIVFDL